MISYKLLLLSNARSMTSATECPLLESRFPVGLFPVHVSVYHKLMDVFLYACVSTVCYLFSTVRFCSVFYSILILYGCVLMCVLCFLSAGCEKICTLYKSSIGLYISSCFDLLEFVY